MLEGPVLLLAPLTVVRPLAAGCPGLNALDPLCQAASLGGTVVSSGVNAVLSGLSQWVAGGAEWLLAQIGDVLLSTTTIDVGASWFRLHYGQMTALAGVVVLPLLVVSTLQAIYRQNAGQLMRAFFIQLPLALLLGVVAIQVVILCLSATDAMCTAVAGGSGSAVTTLLAGITGGLVSAVGDPTMATFVLLMVGLLVAVAAFVLWLELLVRAAAVYVAVLFLPLALATLVWPSISHWCRRLVETLAALILSKFVIVASLSLAASAVSSGTAGNGDHASGFASVLAGGALLVLATFVPFAILRLIPLVEAGAVSHLEGARQRGAAAITRVPRTAASFAMSEGMAAVGGAKLSARAGAAGTGGAGLKAVGGAGADHAGDPVADSSNGGSLPNADGVMIGLPGSGEAATRRMEDSAANPRPKGPKPLLAAPINGGAVAGGDAGSSQPESGRPEGGSEPGAPTVDTRQYLGKAVPGQMRYYLGHNEGGRVIEFLPPTEPRVVRPAMGGVPTGKDPDDGVDS